MTTRSILTPIMIIIIIIKVTIRTRTRTRTRTTKPKIQQQQQQQRSPVLGRKEAALLLRPSMVMVAGILLVAAAPHGVTEGQIVKWIENGSLPLLRAFSSPLLPEAQREPLTMVAPFFSLPVTPSASVLQNIAKRIHVACGYQPPKVKLVAPVRAGTAQSTDYNSKSKSKMLAVTPSPRLFRSKSKIPMLRRRKERILTTKSLYAPGRLVRPSTVPLLLGQLVSELGFSQMVLNYSLALVGLAVSKEALLPVGGGEDTSWTVPEDYHKEEETCSDGKTDVAIVGENTAAAPSVPSATVDRHVAPWDEDTAPVFDPSQPEEELRQKKYKNMLYQRKYRAKKRAKLGLLVQAQKRNKKYCKAEVDGHSGIDVDFDKENHRDETDTNASNGDKKFCTGEGNDNDDHSVEGESSDNDKIPVFDLGKSGEKIGQESIHKECRKERSSQSTNENEVPKRKRTWLPSPIMGARSDKLGDVNRILAVVVVACKLIPNWEQNHRYIFFRGRRRAINSSSNSNKGQLSSESTSEQKNNTIRAMDRFVPWNQEYFRYIGNGKTETDYIDFLEEFIFRGNSYALPKFVESLKESSPGYGDGDDDGHIKDDDDDDASNGNSQRRAEELQDENDRNNCNTRAVIPNETVLGWKSQQKEKTKQWVDESTSFQCKTPLRIDQVPYRLTTVADTKGFRTLDSPLGSLIEYIAHKTETQPDLILKHLIELDKEMGTKYNKRSQKRTDIVAMTPGRTYDVVMGNGDKKKNKALKKKNLKTPVKRARKPAARDNEDDEIEVSSNTIFVETNTLLSPLQFRDVLTQRSPEIEELLSVGEIECV
mmetsp:Transcript_17187/g.35912  ORF Transcript_17187/g.35912 Transcript_17187/m.35912 type:complete len:822 (+) Transcript_17187:475-2940(+)